MGLHGEGRELRVPQETCEVAQGAGGPGCGECRSPRTLRPGAGSHSGCRRSQLGFKKTTVCFKTLSQKRNRSSKAPVWPLSSGSMKTCHEYSSWTSPWFTSCSLGTQTRAWDPTVQHGLELHCVTRSRVQQTNQLLKGHSTDFHINLY